LLDEMQSDAILSGEVLYWC